LKEIQIKADAFIPGRLGTWLPEPGNVFTDWQFKTDGRDFGGNFQNSRIRSWAAVESKDIGDITNINGDAKAGPTHRRDAARPWYHFVRVASISHTETFANRSEGCNTKVILQASGSYPFIDGGPDIDYKFIVYMWKHNSDEVEVRIGYDHNTFPNYEVIVDGRVLYKFDTQDTGPSIFNLALGQNEKGVVGPFYVRADTR
jgi:hypothetical protein